MKTFEPIPPRIVASGPVLENVDRDAAVDLWKFPVPLVHEHDGGRYIGTEDVGRHARSRRRVGQRGDVSRDGSRQEPRWDLDVARQARTPHRCEVHAQGRPCPLLICCGQDPLLFLAANHEVPYGVSEYDYAGGHRGRPFDLLLSEQHGLPMRDG